MNRKIIVFAVFFALFAPFIGFSEETYHIVKRGETIYSIARSYGASAQAVLSLNGINDARNVQAGQRIRIPGTGTAGQGAAGTAAAGNPTVPGGRSSGYGEYRVEKDDTLYSIARRHGVSLAGLLDMNGFSPSYVLKAGERIRVPLTEAGVSAAQGQAAAGQGGIAAGSGAKAPGGALPAAAGGKNPQARSDPQVRWPVSAKEVSYIKGKLYGVQLTGERLEPVKSLTRGTVVSAGPYRGFGRVAIVQMPGGYLYVYGGCESLSVKEGDKVAPGTELGRLGIDAKSEKPQLFFFVYRSNNPIDPAAAPRA